MTQIVQADRKLPKIEELYSNSSLVAKNTELNIILNSPPKATWIKEHPTIANYKYIPIEVTEYLLTMIFVRWWVEVKDVKLVANSVVVTVRLWVIDPVTGDEIFQDGIGAAPIQTKQGSGAIDFNEMKSAAIQMGAPAAESYAIKDAAEKFGKIFGKDINRKNGMDYAEALNSRIVYYDDAPASDDQKRYIERLIPTSTFDEDQRTRIEREYLDYRSYEAEMCITSLLENQLHPIFDNARPTQTDIKETIKQQTK